MDLKELFLGTRQEKEAQQTVLRFQDTTNLKIRDRQRLDQARILTRRLFIRRGVTASATLAALVAGGAALLPRPKEVVPAWENAATQAEKDFFRSLESLPLEKKLAQVDQFYSKQRLSIETARAKVLPLWLQNFIVQTDSNLKLDEVLPRIQLLATGRTGFRKEGDEPGSVTTDFKNKTMSDVTINFSEFKSDDLIRHPSTGEPAHGIVFLRTLFNHEMCHFDTAFRPEPNLGPLLNKHNLINPPLDNPEKTWANGFTFYSAKDGEDVKNLYWNPFDEEMTDVVNSYIATRSRLSITIGYPKSGFLRDFLDRIGFNGDRLIELHRNSDLSGFIKELSSRAYLSQNKALPSEEALIVDGVRLINALRRADLQVIETFAPGSSADIFSKTTSLVRFPK